MPFSDSMSLERALTRLELVDHETLAECRQELGKRPSPENLLSCLSRRNALTTYQVGRLRKGETDGLRLGPYKLLYRNASGSFARVYRAASVEDGRLIGIKLLRQRWAADPRIVSLFRREGELGKRLKHRNIVPIYDVVTEGNQHYLTMEFVEGGNFRDFLRIRGKFSPSEATRYIIDMAEGLNYALVQQRITHRDLKLTNVLLSSQGVAKLVDFGLAGSEGAMSQFEEEVDRALEYAALEKGSDAPDNDPRSDLYFLGAIYHELLTGRAPYPPTADRQERKRFGRYRDVKPLRAIEPNIPSSVEVIVRRLMNVNPNDRYQTAAEVLIDLKALLPELSAADAAATSSFNTAGYIEDDPLLASVDTATLMGSDTSGEDSGSFRDRDLKPSLPTILCVEDRPKHQNALRDYFTRHGYRVLILTDAQRALNRMAGDPPQALLLIGDVLGDQLPKITNEALIGARRYGTAVIVALGKKEIAGLTRLEREPQVTILPQPVTLRDIRHAVGEFRHRNASTG